MSVRTCPKCEGNGEIRFNRSDRNDPQHDDTERCRRCGGTGVLKETA